MKRQATPKSQKLKKRTEVSKPLPIFKANEPIWEVFRITELCKIILEHVGDTRAVLSLRLKLPVFL